MLAISRPINFALMLLATLLLVFLAAHVAGDCNVCTAGDGFACVSFQHFAFCENGRPISGAAPIQCPSGRVCSTVAGPPCQVPGPETVVDCQGCNRCVNGTFACTGTHTFALCLGADSPSSMYTGICEGDLVCSTETAEICSDDTDPESAITATCSFTDDDPVTEAPPPSECTEPSDITAEPTPETASPTPSPSDAEAYCKVIQEEGRYPLGSTAATTCKQYVRCFEYLGVWRGALYQCPGDTYFHSSIQRCSPELPPRCSSRVRSTSFMNIVLE